MLKEPLNSPALHTAFWCSVPLTLSLLSTYFLNLGSPCTIAGTLSVFALSMKVQHFEAQHFPSFVYMMLKIKLKVLSYQMNTPAPIFFLCSSLKAIVLRILTGLLLVSGRRVNSICYSMTRNSSPWPLPTANSGSKNRFAKLWQDSCHQALRQVFNP